GHPAGARAVARDCACHPHREGARPRDNPAREPVGPRRQGRAHCRKKCRGWGLGAGDWGTGGWERRIAEMSRLASTFARIRSEGRPGLVTYTTAGDPDLPRSAEILKALDRAGADVLEVGVPFSDPLADGPVIQRATERALAAGGSLRAALSMIEKLRPQILAPIIVFSYANPLLRLGLDAFARQAADAGVDGVLALD